MSTPILLVGLVAAVFTLVTLRFPGRPVTIFLIALFCAVFAWVLSLKDQISDLQTELSTAQLQHERQAREASDALALAHAEIRELEHAHAQRLAAIDSRHQQEFADAQTAADRTVADLRHGALRLRKQLAATSCPAGLQFAGPSPGVDIEAPGLRPEDAGFLVRLADECDADLRAAQAVIDEDRRLCGSQPQQEP